MSNTNKQSNKEYFDELYELEEQAGGVLAISPEFIVPPDKKTDTLVELNVVDLMVDKVIADSQRTTVSPWLKRSQAWVNKFDSLEAIRNSISDLYDQLSPDELASSIEQSSLIIHLAGMAEVINEEQE